MQSKKHFLSDGPGHGMRTTTEIAAMTLAAWSTPTTAMPARPLRPWKSTGCSTVSSLKNRTTGFPATWRRCVSPHKRRPFGVGGW